MQLSYKNTYKFYINECMIHSDQSRRCLKVVAMLFLFPFTLVSKKFIATGKTGSWHHISVSSVANELLISRPNFLINCHNQSIPCCDNPFLSLIKQCRDTDLIVETK